MLCISISLAQNEHIPLQQQRVLALSLIQPASADALTHGTASHCSGLFPGQPAMLCSAHQLSICCRRLHSTSEPCRV